MWQSPPLKISQPEQATCHNPPLTKLTNQILPPAAANLCRPPSQLRANLHREHTATSLTHQPWKLPPLRSPHLRAPEHRDAAPPFSPPHLLRRAHHDNTIFTPPRGLLRDPHDSAAHNHDAPSPAPVPPPPRSSSSLAPPDRAVTTCPAAPSSREPVPPPSPHQLYGLRTPQLQHTHLLAAPPPSSSIRGRHRASRTIFTTTAAPPRRATSPEKKPEQPPSAAQPGRKEEGAETLILESVLCATRQRLIGHSNWSTGQLWSTGQSQQSTLVKTANMVK
ncbi:hypothetical protein DEO72_LG2g3382 [Vigna unguiculata]|uniref:Uncharacterized protein n=1 Tax=Vigna unguiculata TaxID=3917 RepID=A0A4D6L3F6_VIGUN|nr:hypothetical protein DEO72_LG2g3382 [Vigna unguiculata]